MKFTNQSIVTLRASPFSKSRFPKGQFLHTHNFTNQTTTDSSPNKQHEVSYSNSNHCSCYPTQSTIRSRSTPLVFRWMDCLRRRPSTPQSLLSATQQVPLLHQGQQPRSSLGIKSRSHQFLTLRRRYGCIQSEW